MLSARSVTAAAIATLVVSLLAAVVQFLVPSENYSGENSHGRRAMGYAGLYQTLEELGVSTNRLIGPPAEVLARAGTLVYLTPIQPLVDAEPGYLKEVTEWVQRGGRVVFAPNLGWRPAYEVLSMRRRLEPVDVLAEFGLESVELVAMDLSADPDLALPRATRHRRESFAKRYEREFDSASDFVDALLPGEPEPPYLVPLAVTGTLAERFPRPLSLAVPRDGLQVLELGTKNGPAAATGEIHFEVARPPDESDEAAEEVDQSPPEPPPLVVAASFRRGAGEVVVVSDPRILQNRYLAQADNAVLAYRLLTGGESEAGKTVVFDEFYHGMTVRGNPFWLAARFPYSLFAIAVLVACGVWVWRDAVALGPPLAPAPVQRRSIAEYVDAMGRFQLNARGSIAPLARELRDGAVWLLRQTLGMRAGPSAPGPAEIDQVIAVLAKKDPQRAHRLEIALVALERALESKSPSANKIVPLLKEVTECLSES